MIPYSNSSFGLWLLTRVHGSALYKSLLPALISTIIYFIIAATAREMGAEEAMFEFFIHPYPMQALVTAFTFLLVFRANYSYNRWWEAYTAVYLMHSKWLDLATEIAAFHYQSRRYDEYKPPSFGANPGVQSLNHFVSSEFLETSFDSNNDVSGHAHLNQGSSSSFGTDAAGLVASMSSGTGGVLTPPPSPKKQTRLVQPSPMKSPMRTPNARTRHARQPTLAEIMQQMDAAEEEQAKRQSLLLEETKESDESEGREDDNAGSKNVRDQINSEKGSGAETSGKTKLSWLHKIKHRRSDSKTAESKKNNVHIEDGLPIATINAESDGNVNKSTSRRRRRKEKMKRRRSRHQPATARLFNQRKTIVRGKESTLPREEQLEFRDRFDTKTGKSYSVFTAFSRKHLREGNLDPDKIPPMLFLEECAHLLSLMSAVAFSTLRNDLPEAESPLTVFEPGLPWPLVDPDGYRSKHRKGWTQSKSRLYSVLQFALGRSRNDKARTLYNAARPFRVIGNVSDAEIEKLQEARGPLAKVSLISMWLLELISREYQAGSTGDVASPILSRLYQFVSEGLAGYNQARKIAYIPFPFPHAQITTLYLGIIDFFVTPLLMTTFVSDITLGCFLNLFSVLCFTGLHEVAREIENPFQNVPNDVPLNNYQAQFNEGLMVMFYGYHPDAYWNEKQSNSNSSSLAGTNPSGQNNSRSPNPSTTVEINVDDKAIQLPNLTKSQSSVPSSEPIGFSVEGNDQEGVEANKTTTNICVDRPSDGDNIIGNQSTIDAPADDFLRHLAASRFDTSSFTGSFQKVPSENDSVRMPSDTSRGASPTPIEFRIPDTTLSPEVAEKKTGSRTKSSSSEW